MASVQWIKIATDIFNDEKILMIESMPEADAVIVIWFKLLTLAGRTNSSGLLIMNNKIAYTEDMLATVFRKKKTIITLALGIFEELGMIELVENTITIPNWEKHQNIDGLENIKKINKARQQRFRDKQKLLLSSNVTRNVDVTDCHATEEEVDIDKEEDIILVQQIDEIWNLYPRKKGKAVAIKKIPKLIKKHSFKIIKRCVERYADEVSDKDMQFIKNGSTFFNNGYQDYLADDYVPETKITPKGNKFHNFKDDENVEEKKLEEILLKRRK